MKEEDRIEESKRHSAEFAHRKHLERSLTMAHRLLAQWMRWWDHADTKEACYEELRDGEKCREATDAYVRMYCKGKPPSAPDQLET